MSLVSRCTHKIKKSGPQHQHSLYGTVVLIVLHGGVRCMKEVFAAWWCSLHGGVR
jgi:hypothetical protein